MHNRLLLWRTTLDRRPSQVRHLAALLCADERERASALAVPAQRDRYVVGRAMMRVVLGQLLDDRPEALRFVYGPAGRPALGGAHAGSGIDFNLSHGEGVAVLAVVHGRRVGADVERLRPVPRAPAIVRRLFAEAEQAVYFALPGPDNMAAFFRGWTCKEAVRKAEGVGLRQTVRGVEVAPPCLAVVAAQRTDARRPSAGQPAGEAARLVAKDGRADDAERWSLWVWPPYPGWVAAVAVDSPVRFPPEQRTWLGAEHRGAAGGGANGPPPMPVATAGAR